VYVNGCSDLANPSEEKALLLLDMVYYYRKHSKAAAIVQGITHEVHAPAFIGLLRRWR
jgi:hypothetical protein